MSALGRLVASVVLDTAEFTSGTDKAKYQAAQLAGHVDRTLGDMERKAKATMAGMAGILAAGFSVAAMKSWVEETIRANAALDDMAEKTGASVETLSGLVNVAKVGGHDVSLLEASMAKLAKGMVNADEETKGAGKALAFLGVSATDTNGKLKNSGDLMQEIAARLATYADGTGKAAIAQTLFGKSGAQLLPYLKDLAEGTDNVARVTAAQAAQAEALEKNLRRLAIAKGDLARTVAQELIPVLDTVARMYLETKTASDGTLASAQRLASDNSLRTFFENVAYAGAFAVDSFNALITATQALGQVIAGTARMAPAMLDMLAGLTSGNGGQVAAAYAAISKIQEQTNTELQRILGSHKSIRFELDARLQKEREIAAVVAKYAGADYRDQNDRRGQKSLEWRGDSTSGADKTARIRSDLGDIDKLVRQILDKAEGFDSDFSEKMAKLWMGFATGRISLIDFQRAQAALIQMQPVYNKAIDAEAKARKDAEEALRKYNEEQYQLNENVAKQIGDLQTQIETFGMSRAATLEYAAAQLEAQAATTSLDEATEGQIELLKKRAQLMRELAGKQAQLDNLSASANNFRSWVDVIDGGFQAALRGARSFGDYIKNSLIQALYALTARQWSISIAAMLTGTSQSAAASAMGGSASGGIGSLFGSMLTGSGILNTASGGLTGGIAAGWAGSPYAGAGPLAGVGSFVGANALPIIGIAALAGALIKKFSDPDGLAQRTGSFGDSSLGGDTRTRGSSIFGGFGITASKWFGDDMIETLKKFFDGLGAAEDRLAKFMSPDEIARIRALFSGQTKEYGFGTEHGDFSGTLGQILSDRINAIFNAVDPGLQKYLEGFKGTGEELQAYAEQLLDLRQRLGDPSIADALKRIPDLTIDGILKMQQAGESLADTFNRVVGEFITAQNALNSAIASRNPVFARELVLNNRNSIARQFLDSIGEQFTEANLAKMAWHPESFGNLNTQQMQWLTTFLGLQTDLERLDQQIASGTGSVSVSLSNFGEVIDNTVSIMAGARDSLVGYLQGSLLSDLSPLTPMQQYSEARSQYLANLAQAQAGDPDAINAFGGYRDNFLRLSRSIYASSGQYNADYFSTFNQGASLTGGQVQPLTTLAYQQGVQQMVTTMAGVVSALGDTIKVQDDEVRAELADVKAMLNRISTGALTNTAGALA